MKTSELTGVALDWAVARAKGYSKLALTLNGEIGEFKKMHDDGYHNYSTDWAQGGPIIERERIGVWPSASIEGMWAARPDYEVHPNRLPPTHGDTPLIAAMRCYVTSKLGDDVEIPKELT